MISRREFAKLVTASGIASATSGKVASALAQSSPIDGATQEDKSGSLPEWTNHIDPDWVKETLVGGLLDYWLKASVEPSGFIQENLDREWKPWGTQREASLNG